MDLDPRRRVGSSESSEVDVRQNLKEDGSSFPSRWSPLYSDPLLLDSGRFLSQLTRNLAIQVGCA